LNLNVHYHVAVPHGVYPPAEDALAGARLVVKAITDVTPEAIAGL
jgi:ribosomal protein S11